jgi:Zn-dependent M28 family amino/carboxypeptidase
MKQIRILLLLAALPIAFLVLAQFTERREIAGLDLQGISGDRIRAHTTFLSDDLFEGRAPATRGGDLAARYIATQFELLGLQPAGDEGTFFQQVPLVEAEIASQGFRLTARGAQGRRDFALTQDVAVLASVEAPAVSLEAPVVFVGHGIVAPEYDWNDYAGVDVRGKVVMALVNDPPATDAEPQLFGGRALTYYGRWTYKYEEAARQGAAGVILVHTDASATYPFHVVLSTTVGTQVFLPAGDAETALRLKAWMTDEASTALAAAGGHDLSALKTAALTRGATAVPLDVTVSLALQQRTARKTAPNVVARLPGRNDAQAVVFSSHYDHIGMREMPDGGDGIFNGARDNASGIAAMLEVARAYAGAAEPPGRTVYFLATTAEERGLLGAEYFVQHPPLPVAQMAANLNMDSMNVYGPASSLVLLGADRSSLGALVKDVARQWTRTPSADAHPERGYFFRSDHFPFARAGVPALSLSHADAFTWPRAATARRLADAYNTTQYHQPSDEVSDEWDWTGAVDDTRLMADLGWRIAADPRMPAYDRGDQFAQPRASAPRR